MRDFILLFIILLANKLLLRTDAMLFHLASFSGKQR